MKRRMLLAAVVPLALLWLLPMVDARAQELGPPSEAASDGGNGFHGFAQFDTHAQGQLVTLTGYLNAFREDNSWVGGVSEINGPPATSRNITALIFRGKGATFVYGVLGGQGGGRGTLPDPPPGEANAFYPTDPPEMTWSGPITGMGSPQVVDSRFYAKATEVPTGRTEGTITGLSSENFFKVGQATVVTHTEPAEGGVQAEAVSVLTQVEIGPLVIQKMVSRAFAFVPTSGDPQGIATTVVEGATVAGTPVQITDKGIVVTDKTNPLGQEEVNKQMAAAGFPDVRLLPSIAKPGEDGSSVTTAAGTLEFIKYDEGFGASNPQGLSGGGFSIGGAEAYVNTQRCKDGCGGAEESTDAGGNTQADPLPPTGQSTNGAAPDTTTDDTGVVDDTTGPVDVPAPAESYALSGDPLGGGGGLDFGGVSGATTAVTPGTSADLGGSLGGDLGGGVTGGGQVAGGTPFTQQSVAAYTGLSPKSAEWFRDLYLGAGVGLGILFVGQRLARAFS